MKTGNELTDRDFKEEVSEFKDTKIEIVQIAGIIFFNRNFK